uniref:Putative RNA-directed DNA polymerase n=1 Tax=Sipha flava TaxID=143950 RepID=A0A2S2Q1Q6_9HEMI
MQEIIFTLTKCKSHSPGPDSIPYIFIQNFGPNSLKLTLTIFNRIFTEGFWPSTWKNGTVIPIPKPEKDKFKSDGYRPITLLNTLCKILEKVINYRLTWILEKHKYLSKHQYGFRKNKNTIDNLTQINHEINQTLKKKQIMGLVNLDISKAYDCTWRHNIIVKLNQILCQGKTLDLITDFLKDRTFKVKANGHLSKEFTQENGVPQGSALSVTLFLLAIDDIIQSCSLPTKCNLFADDFSYSCRSNNISSVRKHLQTTTDNLVEWARNTGFKFAPTKSNLIIFTKKRKVGELLITLNNKQIPIKKSVKILGIFFDCRRTWKTHIHYLKSSTSQSLNILKILSHTSWGGKSRTLIKIHKSIIQSKIHYGSNIYKSASQSILKKIDSTNNTGLRLAIGAFRSSPIYSIYNTAGEPIPEIKRKDLSLKYITRYYRSNNTNPPLEDSESYDELEKYGIDLKQLIVREQLSTPPWTSPYEINTDLSAFLKTQTSPEMFKRYFLSIIENYKEYQEVYTDASKTQDQVGISIILKSKNILMKLPNTCSIYTAEAIAILEAIKSVIDDEYPKHIILSDSLSTLYSIKNQFKPGDIATKILNNLNEALSKNKQIILMWVPGHSGIEGNELADKQAKIAATNPKIANIAGPSYNDLKRHISHITNTKWLNTWKQQNTKLNTIQRCTNRWINNSLK